MAMVVVVVVWMGFSRDGCRGYNGCLGVLLWVMLLEGVVWWMMVVNCLLYLLMVALLSFPKDGACTPCEWNHDL
jgi:hypothetical protein